tara:strand:- start:1125 stop:1301 length:177 start_codon:yes stop_codon:yes gene_type:complete
MGNIQKGDKVFFNFSRNTEPEFEVYEVLDYGSMCRLRHIETGTIQKSLVRTERLTRKK